MKANPIMILKRFTSAAGRLDAWNKFVLFVTLLILLIPHNEIISVRNYFNIIGVGNLFLLRAILVDR